MQIPVRLYRQHDMDLIRMYMNKTVRFTAEMKNAIISYANNKPYSIQITDSPPEYKGYLKTSIMVHVSIDEKKYPEVTVLFSKLKKGQRCAFIKTLTRRCMTELPLSTYFNGDGIIMSKEAALKLEDNGFVVEGNNLLINNTIPQNYPTKTPEAEFAKSENKLEPILTKQEKRQPSSTVKDDISLNPLTTSDVKEKKSEVEPVFNSNEMYIPDDNIPYVNELTESKSFGEPEINDLENGDSNNTFDLFGKLAH